MHLHVFYKMCLSCILMNVYLDVQILFMRDVCMVYTLHFICTSAVHEKTACVLKLMIEHI
jgi:hypothetical protein